MLHTHTQLVNRNKQNADKVVDPFCEEFPVRSLLLLVVQRSSSHTVYTAGTTTTSGTEQLSWVQAYDGKLYMSTWWGYSVQIFGQTLWGLFVGGRCLLERDI